MAKEVKPIPTNDQSAALAAWIEYVKQNPSKAEAKKVAYFTKYNLPLDTEVKVDSEEVKELKELKKKIDKENE